MIEQDIAKRATLPHPCTREYLAGQRPIQYGQRMAQRSRRPPASPDPIALFQQWFQEAQSAGISAPEAMTLATATRQGAPSARIVLLKDVSPRGFVFYTNYESRKGRILGSNPQAALVFFWEKLQRQVRVEGKTVPVPRAESDRYFASRDRGSQLGAWASDQSREILDREALLARLREFEARFEGKAVPRPPHWGGYRVVPSRIEFWTAGEHRLHDRFVYARDAGKWAVSRLSP